MKDAAGNYTFSYKGNNYKIMRMGWREQREFIKIFKDIFDENNQIVPFTDEFNNAQDWILPRIAHINNGLQYLKDDYLESHLETFNEVGFQTVSGIFTAAIAEISTHFFPEGSTQNNLNPDVVMSLESTDYQTPLSKMLS